MATDHIRYDVLARDALRGVLRRVLADAAEHGLPGEHHFFITFLSTAEGVKLSPRLLAQYPEEMTVILQHQFWDLAVSEDRFEVGLSFGGIPERLVVPFNSACSSSRPMPRPKRQPQTFRQCRRPRPFRHSRRSPRRPPNRGTNRPSRARAPKSCGWTVSARNNLRARNPAKKS
jgi:hypothetical protein